MLEFINFKKYYYNIPSLDIPAFAINTGIHLLRGSNGSGKTTLLRSLAGLLKFEGDIKLDNISLKDSPLIQRKLINYSEADPKFPPFLTGMDFIKLFALLKQFSAEDTDAIMERLKIDAYANNPIGTYSSGMLKKLSVTLAFIGEPKIILLDEPFANLDAESVMPIYELIRDWHLKSGITFIITNHQDFVLDFIKFDSQILLQGNSLKLEE
jgi:ABC-2 type transport system ATP-binding protein